MSNSVHKFTVHNVKYTAVMSGQTVRVLDRENGGVLAKFHDLKAVYHGAFHPEKNILAVKSTLPWLAFYCLDTMSLIRKVRIRKPNNEPQDAGFCFSADGKYFLNIEFTPRNLSNLVIYDCENFTETKRFFETDQYVLRMIERHSGVYILVGYERDSLDVKEYFIARFDGEKIISRRAITSKEYYFFDPYSETHYQD